jgi:hypothetical protein
MLLSSPGLCPFPGIRLSFGGLSRGFRLQIHGCFALLLPRLGSLSLSFLLLLNSTGTSIDLSRRSCGSETKEPCKQSFKPRDSAGHMEAAKQSSMHECGQPPVVVVQRLQTNRAPKLQCSRESAIHMDPLSKRQCPGECRPHGACKQSFKERECKVQTTG